jgi:hypothetical protein
VVFHQIIGAIHNAPKPNPILGGIAYPEVPAKDVTCASKHPPSFTYTEVKDAQLVVAENAKVSSVSWLSTKTKSNQGCVDMHQSW